MDTSDIKQSIVRIVGPGDVTLGTGFLLSEEYIVTCWHVIEGLERIYIAFENSESTVPVELSSNLSSHDDDVAILRLATQRDRVPVVLGTEWKVGDSVWSYGFQYREHFKSAYPVYGKISGDAQITKGQQLIVVSDTDVQRGLSGAPLLNLTTGRVIGIINAKFNDKGIGFAIPIVTIEKHVPVLKTRLENQYYDFKKKVSQLFETMGYQIKPNNELSIPDIQTFIGEIKAGPTIIRTLVGCIQFEKELQNSDIERILFLLGPMLSNRKVDKLILVSDSKFSEGGKGLADGMGAQILSYEDIEDNLIDFSEYIRSIIYDYENFQDYAGLQRYPIIEQFRWCNLYKHYVDLHCLDPLKGEEFESLTNYITDWIYQGDGNHLSILGDYGTGKTSACLNLTYKLAKAYARDPNLNRIPIFVPLRNFDLRSGISRLIIDTLSEYGVKVVDYHAFNLMLRAGKFLIIFDGFDEMADRLDRHGVLQAFEQLSRLVVQDSKVILNCRMHYFRTERQSIELLTSETMTPLMQEVVKRRNYHIIQLLKFDETQILELLGKYAGDDYNSKWEQMQSIYNLSDLARTPILLNLIINTLSHLLSVRSPKQISSTSLYDIYTQYWLERDDDRSNLTKEERSTFVEELAWQMYSLDKLSLSSDDLGASIIQYFSKNYQRNGEWLAQVDTNIRTCSFLARDKFGNYLFAHKSFMEFFVAKKLHRTINDWAASNYWSRIVPYEVIAFLQDLLDSNDIDRIKKIALERENDELLRGLCMDILISLGTTIKDEPMIFRLRFSNNGNDICTVGADCVARVWTATSLKLVRSLRGHEDWIRCITYSPDGKLCATGGWDKKVIIWALPDYEPFLELQLMDRVNTVCFTPDGKKVICGGFDRLVTIWDTTKGNIINSLKGHTDNIREIRTNPTGTLLASAGLDRTIRLWNLTGLSDPPLIKLQDEPIIALEFSPNGRYLASGTWTGDLTVWEFIDKRLEKLWSNRGHTNMINTASFTADSKTLATASDDRKVKIWEVATGDLLRSINAGDDFVSAAFFSPNGEYLCAGGYDCNIRLWNTKNWELINARDLRKSESDISQKPLARLKGANFG